MTGLIVALLYTAGIWLLVHFARKESIEEEFADTIGDIEGRLAWAQTRPKQPFGMHAQIKITGSLLVQAKQLWVEEKWHQAYCLALKSQKAIDRAQDIYCNGVKFK